MMYGGLKCMASRLPNIGFSSSLQRRTVDRLSALVTSHRTFAIRTDFTETVYDNEDGGPKCRGIDLLRDPNFNKAGYCIDTQLLQKLSKRSNFGFSYHQH